MIKIQLQNKYLDTYASEQVELSWDGFRFMHNLRAGYTNDLKIPKTTNNLSILNAVGLLDSQTQLFGTKTVKGILQLELRMFPVFVQVASIDKEEIGICLYEDVFPEAMKQMKLRDHFIDSNDTILMWNKDSLSLYPTWFKQYDYGMTYDVNYAQYHPIKQVNSIINDYSTSCGYSMPLVENDWYCMATRKKVCPQNERQIIEGALDRDTGVFALSGGQHITNDLDINYGEGSVEITFNRVTTVRLNIYVSWAMKSGQSHMYSTPFNVHWQDDYQNHTQAFSLQGNLYRNHIDKFEMDVHTLNGTKLDFNVPNPTHFNSCYILIDARVYNYQITEEDYDTDLTYMARRPRLLYYDYNANQIYEGFFDGTPIYYSYRDNNNNSSVHAVMQTESRSLSYFGFFANMPNIAMCDFWYSMQWLYGKKLDFDHQHTIKWSDIYQTATIEGSITQIRPKSDKLGQKNYIKYQEDEFPALISEIPNQWLQETCNLHESKFYRVENIDALKGKIKQYSNPEHEVDENAVTYQEFEYKVDFEDIDNVTIWWNANQSEYIRDIPIPTLGFELLKQSMEVDIVTFTPQLRDKDIIYIDGRKFFIVTCKTNLDTQKSELTCLLIPNILKASKRTQTFINT